MVKKYNQKLGGWGEELAAQFFIKQGYKLLARNVRSMFGEIDLIVANNRDIVFVEVKTRTTSRFGYGEQAVNYRKQQKIRRAIEKYLAGIDGELSPRFDVLVVELFTCQPKFVHYENVELG